MPDRDSVAPLITALLDGVYETPLWSSFLDQLRQATRADYAMLMFHPPGRPLEDALHLISGEAPPARVERSHRRHLFALDPFAGQQTAENRPYTLDELFRLKGGPGDDLRRELVEVQGLSALRQIRVKEPSGVDARLTILRRGDDFTPAEVALLSDLAPVLRGVLRLYVGMERERFAASLTAETVRRLRFGWLSLDATGRVLDCDEQGADVLAQSGVLSRGPGDRLVATPAALGREILEALERIAQRPHGRPRAITLRREPWLDMLLTPSRRKPMSPLTRPVAIAYLHGDSWRPIDRYDQLAELFALSPRQAQLALALSRGMTLTEAAAELGVTVETARTYSKAIYAKTGARGLTDLVRIVMRSVLAIS